MHACHVYFQDGYPVVLPTQVFLQNIQADPMLAAITEKDGMMKAFRAVPCIPNKISKQMWLSYAILSLSWGYRLRLNYW